MRQSTTVFAVILLLFLSAKAQKKSDKDNENLLGPVKSVHSELTRFTDMNLKDASLPTQLDVVIYDPNGREIERTIYDDYGFLVGKLRRTHDAAGNLTESVMSDEKGEFRERGVYTYTDGRLTQIVRTDASGAGGYKQINSYDENSRIREEAIFIQDKAVGKTVFKYNPQGNLSEAAFFTADGAKADAPVGPCTGAHRLTYTYDRTGKPILIIAFETDGKRQRSWQYAYDPKGLMVKDVRDSEWSLKTYVYTYEYDSHGNWIKQIGTLTDRMKVPPRDTSQRKTVISRRITYH